MPFFGANLIGLKVDGDKKETGTGTKFRMLLKGEPIKSEHRIWCPRETLA
jgi:hypothetical protein